MVREFLELLADVYSRIGKLERDTTEHMDTHLKLQQNNHASIAALNTAVNELRKWESDSNLARRDREIEFGDRLDRIEKKQDQEKVYSTQTARTLAEQLNRFEHRVRLVEKAWEEHKLAADAARDEPILHPDPKALPFPIGIVVRYVTPSGKPSWYGTVIPLPAGCRAVGKTGEGFTYVMRNDDRAVLGCYSSNLRRV
jgi:hypothetical protein